MSVQYVVLLLVLGRDCVGSDDASSVESRFSLRKLLEEMDDFSTNATNATNPSNATYALNITSSTPLTSQRIPLAIIQVVDEMGLVIDKASTNQNIRLKVKALTTLVYQAPFIKRCWYDQYDSMPSNDSKPLKTEVFVEKGCAERDANLLKASAEPFEENGVLEVQTNLFKLMPLYDDEFSVLDIHCEASLCHVDDTACLVACSKRSSMWKMSPNAETVMLSVAIEVEKEQPTPEPPKDEEESDLTDFLIRGGKQPPPPRFYAPTEAPFLTKYQPYFVVSTLGVVVILLLCVIGIGYLFVSYKNNKKFENVSTNQDPAAGYHGNKPTGLQDIGNAPQAGVFSTKQPMTSPPPAYTNSSAWPAADMKPRSPYRDTRMFTPSEAAVLEARQLLRNNLHAARSHDPVQRRLALDEEARDIYPYEGGASRLQRNPHHAWNGSPERFREPVDIPTSPVGGEWYPTPSARSRSPLEDHLIQKTPMRGRGKPSLLGVALREYFEKYGM